MSADVKRRSSGIFFLPLLLVQIITYRKLIVSNMQGTIDVSITDAVVEGGRLRFTVLTVTDRPEFAKCENSVSRHHEDFIWLHTVLQEDQQYAGKCRLY